MAKFDQQAYNKFLIEEGVIGFFEESIKLKHGRISNWYVNMRNLTDTTKVKDKLVKYVLDFVESKGLEPDLFYGVPEGATKLALFLTDEYAKRKNKDMPLVMGRGKPKEHGEPKDRFFVGHMPDKSKVIVVEDVTTTGGSLINTLESLKQVDVEIIATIGLVNRMEIRDDGRSVEQKVNEAGVRYMAVSDALVLLPLAAAKQKPDKKTLKEVEDYFKKYGIKQLKLIR